MSGGTSKVALRLDLWLWYTRFYKTRRAASDAAKGGHVEVNGQHAKAAREIRPGDVLRIVRNETVYEVTVESLPDRRGPAPEAQRCYVESEASIAKRQEEASKRAFERLGQKAPTEGRPDKRTRRLLRARRSGGQEHER